MVMDNTQQPAQPVYWPRVKAILDGIMARWETRWERAPYPGIHEYDWATPQELAQAVLSGYRAIEPGVPGRETHLVRSLRCGDGGFEQIPFNGHFLPGAWSDRVVSV